MTTVKISGKVQRVRFAGQDGFAIVDVVDNHGKKHTCKGTFFDVGPESLVEIEGEEKNDPRWGPQIHVLTCKATPPTGKDGAAIYLSEAPGITEAVARRIVEALGDEVWAVIAGNGPALAAIKGVGEAKAKDLSAWYVARGALRDAFVALAGWGLNRRACRAVIALYAERTLEVVNENPWKLAETVDGVGFKTADSIALKIGKGFSCVERARAGVLHHLAEDEREGHTFAEHPELLQRVASELPIAIDLVKQALTQLAVDRAIVFCDVRKGEREVRLVYRMSMFVAERAVADDLVRRALGVDAPAGRRLVVEDEPTAKKEEPAEPGDTSFDFGENAPEPAVESKPPLDALPLPVAPSIALARTEAERTGTRELHLTRGGWVEVSVPSGESAMSIRETNGDSTVIATTPDAALLKELLAKFPRYTGAETKGKSANYEPPKEREEPPPIGDADIERYAQRKGARR